MKLNVGDLFVTFKKSSKKKNRSISLSDHSTSTPNSVLPPTPRRTFSGKASSSGSDELWELFSALRSDGGGRITNRELEAVLRRLDRDPPTEEELASMVAEADLDGDGCISLAELKALGASSSAAAGDLRDAFAVFDVDGDGKISAEELMGVFLTLGHEGCTLDDCRRMIGGVDSDGDGFVCFDDFVRMMDGQR